MEGIARTRSISWDFLVSVTSQGPGHKDSITILFEKCLMKTYVKENRSLETQVANPGPRKDLQKRGASRAVGPGVKE